VRHPSPPGDVTSAVAHRIAAFAISLADLPDRESETVVGVTHSPILRAVEVEFRGEDPGEPPCPQGYVLRVHGGGQLHVTPFVSG
jgi:broad specificity phosphatase PhoE